MSTSTLNTTKVKENLSVQSLLGFIADMGFAFVSVFFWSFIYADRVLNLNDAAWNAVAMFLMSIYLFAAGLTLSIIGAILSFKRGNKISKRFSIAGLVIICLITVVNVGILFMNTYFY